MIVYQYIPTKYSLDALKSGSTLLKTPYEFNDTFDCDFYISEKEYQKAYKLFENYCFFNQLYNLFFIQKIEPNKNIAYGKVIRKNVSGIVECIKKTKKYNYHKDIAMCLFLAQKLTSIDCKNLKELFDKRIKEIIETFKKLVFVSCFSLDNKSILMWSHYSTHHKGICIEYEINDSEHFSKVSYKKKEPCFQLTKILKVILGHQFLGEEVKPDLDLYGFVLNPLLTKYTEWKYEKEIRCIFSTNSNDKRIWKDKDNKVFFRMPKPKCIYIGCNAEESYIKNIKDCADDIPVKIMKKVDGDYAVIEDAK